MKTISKRNAIKAASALLLFAGCIAQLQAHHSFSAQYDASNVVNLQGYVTKVEWFNPHVYFYIDVENPETRTVENWGLEMGPPHMLQERGWKRNTLAIGDELKVEATRARDGSTTANVRTVVLASTGAVLGAASSEGGLGNQQPVEVPKPRGE